MKKFKILIFLSAIVVLGLVYSSTIYATTSSTVVINEMISEKYTESDYFEYGNQTYSIYDYKNSIAQSNSNLHHSMINEYYSFAEIDGDDPIVHIIPKEYFMVEGNHFFIGEEYGFFVNTFKEKYYTIENIFLEQSNFHSYIILFDINRSLDLISNVDKAIFQVTVLFQLEFAYVDKEEDFFCVPWSRTNIQMSDYNSIVVIDSEFTGGNVIPIINKDGFTEIKQYRVADISFAGTLSNEQELNYGDQGYSPYKDKGSYFTRMDYIYSALYLEDGKFTWDPHGRSIFGEIVHAGMGMIPFGIGDVLGAIQTTASVISTISEAISTKEHFYSNDNYVMSGFYQNRDDQILHYNGQITKTCYAAFNSDTINALLYESNDYARAEYTISHSALNNQSPNHTRIQSEILMKVVNLSGDVVGIASDSRDHSLREPVYSEIDLENINNINLLKNGVNYFSFTPVYSGEYQINIDNNEYLKVEMDGIMHEGTYISITSKMRSGLTYHIVVENTGEALSSEFIISANSNTSNISVDRHDNYLVKISDLNDFKNIKFSNSSAKIMVFDEFFNIIKNNDTNSGYILLNSSDYYYILIINNNYSEINGNLIISETTDTISLDVNKPIPMIKGDIFMRFVPYSSNYYSFVIFENTNALYQFEIFSVGENLTSFSTQTVGNGYIRFDIYLQANKVYYIGYENINITQGSANMIVKRTEMVFDWYINDIKVNGNTVFLYQGTSFTVNVKIGSVDLNVGLVNHADGQIRYSGGIWTAPYDLAVHSTNQGRISISFENEIYDLNIIIVPTISISVTQGETTTDSNNFFEWTFSNLDPNSATRPNGKIKFIGRLVYSNGMVRSFSVQSFASSGKIYVPSNGIGNSNIMFGTNTVFATIYIDSIEYKQDHNGSQIVYPMPSLSNSYPSTAVAANREFYFKPITFNTMFAGGSGTVSSPYQIKNAWQLNNMRYMVEDVRISSDDSDWMITGHYILMNNFSTSSHTPFVPLPMLRGSLKSSVTRKTITINNLSSGSAYNGSGLFDWINKGTVSNIGVHIVNETNANGYTTTRKGAIAGVLVGGTIENCVVSGSFSNQGYNPKGSVIGGVVGELMTTGTIKGCSSTVKINTYGDAGGIVGTMYGGTVTSSSYSGSINVYYIANSNTSIDQNSTVGGIVGWQASGTVSNCTVYDNMIIKYSASLEATKDKYLKPAIGYIIGRKTGGATSNNTIPASSSVNCVDKGKLYSFKDGGFLGIGSTTYNQYEYVATTKREIGREG